LLHPSLSHPSSPCVHPSTCPSIPRDRLAHYSRACRLTNATVLEVGAGDGLLACKLRQCFRQWGDGQREGEGGEGRGEEEQHGETVGGEQLCEGVKDRVKRRESADVEGTGGRGWMRLGGVSVRVVATDALPRCVRGCLPASRPTKPRNPLAADGAVCRECTGRLGPGEEVATAREAADDDADCCEGVIACDAEAAIAAYEPDMVIACWMPLGVDWTAAMRRQASVREYILVGEKEGGICGHHRLTWRFPGLLTWQPGGGLKRKRAGAEGKEEDEEDGEDEEEEEEEDEEEGNESNDHDDEEDNGERQRTRGRKRKEQGSKGQRDQEQEEEGVEHRELNLQRVVQQERNDRPKNQQHQQHVKPINKQQQQQHHQQHLGCHENDKVREGGGEQWEQVECDWISQWQIGRTDERWSSTRHSFTVAFRRCS
ncbi:hypothetical protein CLOM_g23831, partial [Closterium sp. NIES-68]